jgi:drug/metabolite transporter (DMT)-like permease
MNKWPHIAGIAFSAIFGFSFMFSKMIMNTIPPMGLIAYRFLIAYLVFELLRQLKIVKIKLRGRNIVPIMIVAVLQPVLYFIFESFGVNLTTSAEGGLMIALIPIFVTIFGAIMLKEKPLKIQIGFIIISFIGVLIIQLFKTDSEQSSSLLGFAFLLISVISAALFNIASRSASKNFKPIETTYFMMLLGAISFNIIYIIQLIINHDIQSYIGHLSDIDIILPILYLGVIASVLGFFFVNYALSQLPAHVSSIYANISTIVSVLAGYIFLNEPVGIYHIIGGILIITGVYGTTRANAINRRKKVPNDSINKTIS